jgi:hypothetical protein
MDPENICIIGLYSSEYKILLDDFIEHHINEGFDKIFILFIDYEDKFENLFKNTEFVYLKNFDEIYLTKLYIEKIKNNFDRCIIVNINDFLTTKVNKYNTIKNEINNNFNLADLILISCSNLILENKINIFTTNLKKLKSNDLKILFKTEKLNNLKSILSLKEIFNLNLYNGNSNENIFLNSYNTIEFIHCYKYIFVDNYDETEIDNCLQFKKCLFSIQNEFKSFNDNYYLGILARCKNEFFVKEFCDYYIRESVDKIIILDDDSDNLSIYNNIDSKFVKIYYSKNNSCCHDGDCKYFCTCNRILINEIYKIIRLNFEWIAYIDIDEFITSTDNSTIKQKLKNTYIKNHCISIPWIMMSPFQEKNPQSILETNIYRVNYDNIEYNDEIIYKISQNNGNGIKCKSIFKSKVFKQIISNSNKGNDHYPTDSKKKNLLCIESVKNTIIKRPMKEYKDNISEEDIKKANLLCYHYRIASKEHAICKINSSNWYKTLDIESLYGPVFEIKDLTLYTKSKNK